MARWYSVPYGFGWQKEGCPSTDTADNMVEDYEAYIDKLEARLEEAFNDGYMTGYEEATKLYEG